MSTDERSPDAPERVVDAWIRTRQAEEAASRVWSRFATGAPPAAPRGLATAQVPDPAMPVRPPPAPGALARIGAMALLALALWMAGSIGVRRGGRAGPVLTVAPGAALQIEGATTARAGARLVATGSSPARLSFPPAIELVARPGAALRIRALPAGASGEVHLEQQAGAVLYRQVPGAAHRLRIDVPGARIAVTGTEFRLDRAGDRTTLDVGHGRVEVQPSAAGAAPLAVDAGRRLVVDPGRALTAPEAFNAIVDPDFGAPEARTGSGR